VADGIRESIGEPLRGYSGMRADGKRSGGGGGGGYRYAVLCSSQAASCGTSALVIAQLASWLPDLRSKPSSAPSARCMLQPGFCLPPPRLQVWAGSMSCISFSLWHTSRTCSPTAHARYQRKAKRSKRMSKHPSRARTGAKPGMPKRVDRPALVLKAMQSSPEGTEFVCTTLVGAPVITGALGVAWSCSNKRQEGDCFKC
jgi:hypothetical protein